MIESLGPVVVTVPARADCVHILRAVVAGVGARLDLPIDDVEELRIAVDEAAALLLHLLAPAGNLTLTLDVDRDRLSLQIASDAAISTDWPPPGTEDAWPWRVIVGLSDEAGFDVSSRGSAVWMTRSRDGAGRP